MGGAVGSIALWNIVKHRFVTLVVLVSQSETLADQLQTTAAATNDGSGTQ